MKNTFLLTLLTICIVPAFSQRDYQQEVSELMAKMTLEEKIGQLTLYTSGWDVTGPTLNENYKADIRAGKCGNIFNAHTTAYNRDLQRIAVEETRLGIPLLFGYDVIHGHKTIFPIPLAEACSWDLELTEKSARLATKEAAASGLHWTFNPMLDICRDPRWGRIAEGTGEDPYLGSLLGAAKVRGIQGDDLSDTFTLMACVKHFAAYGAPQAGRDYHTVDMSERELRETYLPPYKACIDAGAATVMASFNEYDGVPATGSKFLMDKVLRQEWGFEGIIVTDYTGIYELVPHGFAEDNQHAGELAMQAGIDMDMQSGIYQQHLQTSIAEGKVSERAVDEAVRRILLKKFELGLFADPYRYSDEAREKRVVYSGEMMQHAREAARKSIVLLKNQPVGGTPLLPLAKTKQTIALIGPLGDNQEDIQGSWHAAGDAAKVVTLRTALQEAVPGANVLFAEGCSTEGNDRSGFASALTIARQADVVIMAVGENYRQNGEAASRTELGLPGAQQALLEAVHATGKPVVAVVMAGRPLTIGWMDENIPAIVNAWHLGTMAGPAIADVLFGDYNPSGKLTVTFPRNVGQIPIHYAMKNTGRPFNANDKYTSKYIDAPHTPLYPFGYGLSYTTFQYSNLSLNRPSIGFGETLEIEVMVTNTGKYAGEETVQLYTRDLVGSVTRPVKELKGFKKIFLQPGEARPVRFTLTSDDLRFYTQDMSYRAEAGAFRVFVGGNSVDVQEAGFELK